MNTIQYLFVSLSIMLVLLTIKTGHSSDVFADTPTVTWAYMKDAEPACWEEKGIARGMDIEIVNHIMNNLGIRVVHKFYPWERAQKYVENGAADGMMTTPTPKRFRYAIFGKENVLPNYWNVFIKKGNIDMARAVVKMTRIEDLKGYQLIDFIGNGWTAAFMKSKGGYTIHEVPRLEQIPLMIASGRGDLSINSSCWTNWWAEKKGVRNQLEEYETDWPWTRFHFVLMVSRKSSWVDKGLIRAMDIELKKMKDSGVWVKILKKYKNPHGSGKPFHSYLDEAYERKHGFYSDYDSYPVYSP